LERNVVEKNLSAAYSENKKMRSRMTAIFSAFVIVAGLSLVTQAQTVLYAFKGGKTPASPSSGVVSDSAGNFYGVTSAGGTHNYGTVYELTEVLTGKAKGTWKLKVLHSFAGGTKDGEGPVGNLVLDSSDILYGVTQTGGAHGVGVAFQLAKPVSGAWKETLLYHFGASASDGYLPQAGLIFDSAGNLYGTTSGGGTAGQGTAFELVAQKTAPWKETILHGFGSGNDGAIPVAALLMDKAGNLYGTTMAGGGSQACFGLYAGCGTVFELTSSKGIWSEKILYALQNNGFNDGNYPLAGVALDAAGNLYGTAYGNQSEQDGDTGWMFQLAKSGNNWTYNEILYLGCDQSCPDGAYPMAGLAFDSVGNFYGATTLGGNYGDGTILKFAAGTWDVSISYQFSGLDGDYPAATPLVTSKGQLVGTTPYGGDLQCNCGVVYQITP
jgi:uncharacterized repeat protein (TIGR03803 family)